MAAGTCLAFLAQAVHDPIVPAVIPFIEANIKQENWHQREAAVMAFGCILVGPDPSVLSPLVNQALPILISMMSDPQSQVKDTTAWTLGRICESLITSIKPDVHLHALVSALVAGLQDSPHIIANCCWALMNLADGLYEVYDSSEEQTATGPLSPYFEGIVGALLQVTETYVSDPSISLSGSLRLCCADSRPSAGNESNYRTSAYEAITSFVQQATPDCLQVVSNTALKILDRMEHLLNVQVRGWVHQHAALADAVPFRTRSSALMTVTTGTTCKVTCAVSPLYASPPPKPASPFLT
jgi:importin subunit beta-1